MQNKLRNMLCMLLSASVLCTALPEGAPAAANGSTAVQSGVTVSAAEIAAEPAAATTTTSTAKSAATTTTTSTAKSAAATTTTSTAKSAATTTTTSTVKSAATTGTVTTAAAADTTTATTVTTVPLPAPVLTVEFDEGFPTGDTVMHLKLLNNNGFRAVSFAAALPDVLSADADADGLPVYTLSDAFGGENLFCYYGAETHRFAVGYSDTAAGQATELLCDVPLHISEEADFGQKYPVKLILSSLVTADGRSFSGIETDAVFIPAASPMRTLSAESLLFPELGMQEQLTLSPAPTDCAVRWESSAPEVVSVDENGLVTALQEGTAVISVTCQKRTYPCAVTVRFDRKMTPESYTAEKQGEQFQLSLESAPEEGVEWISSDPEVLSIDKNGLATVHRNGSVEITVVCGPVTYVNPFTVTIPRTLEQTEYTFTSCDESGTLTLSPAPDSTPQFRSDHPEIASVSADGVITPVQKGSAVISVISEGITYTCHVTVDFQYALNVLDFAARKAGDTVKLRLIPHGSDTPVPVWTSSDPAVASVDAHGTVTVLKEGEAAITGTAGGYTYLCHVSLLPFLRGDVDENGEVDARDAQLTLKHYVDQLAQKESKLTAHQLLAADVNNSGAADVSDALRILKYATDLLAGLEPDWDSLIIRS